MLLRSGHSEVRMSEVCETVAKQCDCGSTGFFLLSLLIHVLAKLLKYGAPAFNCVIPVVGVKTGESI